MLQSHACVSCGDTCNLFTVDKEPYEPLFNFGTFITGRIHLDETHLDKTTPYFPPFSFSRKKRNLY